MTTGAALAILVATLLFAVGCIVVSRQAAATRPLFRDAGMVGEVRNDLMFAVTILLGFLLLIAMTHYESSSEAAVNEARAVTALVSSADGISNRELREEIQHDAVCYARAVLSDDWTAGDTSDIGGEAGGSLRADFRLNELSRSVSAAVRAGYDYDALMSGDNEIRTNRAARLYQGTPFSTALWVISGLSVALLVLMAAMLLAAEYAWVQYLVVGGTALILAFMLVLIGAFSKPFSGESPLPVVSPVVMQTAIGDIDQYVRGDRKVMRSCRSTSEGDSSPATARG